MPAPQIAGKEAKRKQIESSGLSLYQNENWQKY